MSFYRDTYLEIDLDAVRHNVTNLKRLVCPDVEIMAVVKADAYGHGAVMIARELMDCGIRHLAVATLDEALELRNNGLSDPSILIFGMVDPDNLLLCQFHRLTVSVNSLEWLKKAVAANGFCHIGVHVKIDTGMNRLGFTDFSEFREALEILRSDPRFRLEGIYSHLATSEESDQSYYQGQLNRFGQWLETIDTTGLWVHIANSGGSVRPRFPRVNMVRIGLFLNGHNPGTEVRLPFELQPSLALYTKVIQVKTVPAGTRIGYNGVYETTEPTAIGTLPVGYADGYDRRLRGGHAYVDGRKAPVIGRVCMDMTMIALEKPVPEGTPVEL
ncbi:MAG TPA: alanine racemase, partial [Bacillota bacterium]|nr:alanine racemase [Bacillota bacterium]